ncbi:MAG: hypothetical protein ABS939_03685 [Psychrobacillus sp.]
MTIDLTKFTAREIIMIEKLVNEELRKAYNNEMIMGAHSYSLGKYHQEQIELLTVLRAKVLNFKNY